MPPTMSDADTTPDLSRLRIERATPQRGGRTGWIVAIVVLALTAAWLAWPRLKPVEALRQM